MNNTSSNKGRAGKYVSGALMALLVIMAAGLLPGCSIISQPEPMPLMTLRTPLPGVTLCEQAMPAQIVVSTPDAGHGLKSDRIALLFDEREIKYLAGYKWDSAVPAMFQRQFIRYLDATGCFSGVGAESSGISTRYRLQSDIQRLHLCYSGDDKIPTAQIVLRLSLLNLDRGQVIGTQIVKFEEKAAGEDLESLMDALDNVSYRALLDMARWTAGSVRENLEK